MMPPPNLRSVVAQGWRSIGTRRNFSSSPVSNGETQSFYEAYKAGFYASFSTVSFWGWSACGYYIYGGHEMYQIMKLFRARDELRCISDELMKNLVTRSSNE